ncbi:MAG TPA: transglutaminase domain-containing protein [Thermodesulfobacteriota bacterium]|nr:transglutaminase domain-containing protein [Thermodesulfobacteriota bacterium]
MSIYSGGRRVGSSVYTIKKEGGSSEVFEKTSIRIKLLDKVQDVSTVGTYHLAGGEVKSFEYEFDSPSGGMKLTGEKAEGGFRIKTDSVSGGSELFFKTSSSPIPAALLPEWLSSRDMKPGAEYKVPVMDPLTIVTGGDENALLTIHRVKGREKVEVPGLGRYDAWKIVSDVSGMEITSWLTDSGLVVKQEMPPGLTAYKDAEGAGAGGLDIFDITDLTSIPSNVTLDDPRGTTYLKAEISGLPRDGGFKLADGYRQFTNGDTIEIKAEGPDGNGSYETPYKGGLDEYMKPGPLVDSSAPEIAAAAAEITGSEKDAAKAAALINDWVFRNIKKEGTASVPNALDVLKTRSGDCNEHSALYAALARAAGIPTKAVSGTIYIDGRFYYHAWNEVYVGKWVAVDSAFGQMPADATHIKLIEGNLSDTSRIMKAVGKINLSILEASR